ncbi:succinylglutamate desuccinylase/aspartoacylase family protein [Solirhodobacter olei]|uniref:succinylglutamate desuccinylase/aspartoacylase family protein n=1 Tax=Solirhodobacter olei TaxID=2493082 RepID=UPI0013E35556|nr:succinylglutamate desuccinylase/aspartoacylase family protein [Solirhodobacter olei]
MALPNLKTGSARKLQGHLKPDHDLEIPYTLIEGTRPGPVLVITAGVHGSEFCSIEAATRMTTMQPEELEGTLLVLPILNVNGFWKRSIYVMPEDGQNLNRVFPGRPDGSASERLANWLVTCVYPLADAYLDLHGGDLDESLSPFVIYPHGCAASLALARAFGLPTIIASGSPGHTVSAARQLGVPSILPEVSGNGLWDDDKVTRITDGIARVMAHLGMIRTAPANGEAVPRLVTMSVPVAPCRGLWYCFKEPDDPVAKGEPLGEIRSIFGEVLAQVNAGQDGLLLYRLTSLSVNEGEALLGIGEELALTDA